MVRESEAMQRKQMFLVCRYALIFATGALAFVELGRDSSPVALVMLMLVAVPSNLALGQAPPFSFFDAWLQAPVLVADTALISMALLLTRATQESYLFFFFVLLMAAKMEKLSVLGVCAGAIGFASFLISSTPEDGWASPALMRIPFLFATGVFFGYVVLPERTGEMSTVRQAAVKPVAKRPVPRLKSTAALTHAGEVHDADGE